jgi:hypothetical protein
MAKKAKKARAAPKKPAVRKSGDADLQAALREHTAALREHSHELRRRSEALRAMLPASRDISAEVPEGSLVRETALAGKPSKEEVRQRLASATGNVPEALKDDFKVIWMIAGGPGVRDNLMSRINNEFWPGARAPHLTFNEIKGMNIGQLIARIRQLL